MNKREKASSLLVRPPGGISANQRIGFYHPLPVSYVVYVDLDGSAGRFDVSWNFFPCEALRDNMKDKTLMPTRLGLWDREENVTLKISCQDIARHSGALVVSVPF